jgi:putative membrane protein
VRHPHRRFLTVLTATFLLVFAGLAIAPSYRADWLLENWLVFALVAALAVSYRRFPLSRGSYTAIFIFLCLHEVGSHYTYSQVPYDAWFETVIGRSLSSLTGWERNHYDRLVHFVYGAALAYPMRELVLHVTRSRGLWSYFLALNLTLATSTWYELIEWAAAVVFGGELGMAYLGTQGDIWDAQRDTALAGLGAALCMALTAACSALRKRDYAAEWVDKLRAAREDSP